MTNVIRFPREQSPPPLSAVDALVEVQIELARAQLAQVRAETRQAQALWVAYCFKRVLIWGCVLWLVMSFAKAEAREKSILPPAKFDRPYIGTIIVKRDSSASVPCRPRSMSTRLGCTFPPDKDGEACTIYLAERDEIKDAGYSENDLWRHEIAACNGWKGYRPIPGADDLK